MCMLRVCACACAMNTARCDKRLMMSYIWDLCEQKLGEVRGGGGGGGVPKGENSMTVSGWLGSEKPLVGAGWAISCSRAGSVAIDHAVWGSNLNKRIFIHLFVCL